MLMKLIKIAILILALLAVAGPLAAHGFHGGSPGGVMHFTVHGLPLALLGATLLLLSRLPLAARGAGRERLRTAGATLVALGLVGPLLA